MALINSDSKLSEIILHDASTITVLDRFGIALGVGDATVADACRTHGIDIKFFTTILNTYINENYFPQEALEQFSVAEIVDYLSKTNDYYVQNVLPNIERHFSFLISRAPSHNNNLVLMRQFFDEMKSELMQRINSDREQWFPQVCGSENEARCNVARAASGNDVPADVIEDKIDDLINMLIVHLKGDYDHNLGYAVVVAVLSLKKDIRQNNRIRNRILRPISQALSNGDE